MELIKRHESADNKDGETYIQIKLKNNNILNKISLCFIAPDLPSVVIFNLITINGRRSCKNSSVMLIYLFNEAWCVLAKIL